MDYDLSVATPMGDSLVCNYMLKSCVIQIEDREMLVDDENAKCHIFLP